MTMQIGVVPAMQISSLQSCVVNAIHISSLLPEPHGIPYDAVGLENAETGPGPGLDEG
jgi:hypothetical protein